MEPIVVRAVNEDSFGAEVPVGAPLGNLLAITRTAGDQPVTASGTHMGVWECSPGQFERMVPQAEYSYFLSGEGCFTPEGSEPVQFCAGDMIYFQADTKGVWNIRQTVRKAYLIIH
ncbi:hypothetical protein SAMN05216198_1488 [Halopseudomonas litoralis]|uniref:(S)-ureidoglycine aminohydrolase cupin domain-containing protein n=1 Tax=Halopseudomonas litoralis TaxID=797277 RepID=A0A1H1QJD3_9GAMM|nr:cupin domain-containing protein [Halopseudomonas litoralis]SDS23019.1 hypothetical protein SAMN05216198_1488 [Halopseudomonas litoralis]